MDDTTVTTTTPALEWEPYPSAAYYKVWVFKTQALEFLGSDEKISASRYIIENPLAPGKYSWGIWAYNAAGIQISESGAYYFTVAP